MFRTVTAIAALASAASLMLGVAHAPRAHAQATQQDADPGGQVATARFLDRAGELTGTATLSPATGGVFIGAEVRDLPPGQWVAFHIHENGSCEPDGGFESAGGHFNPDGQEHGLFVEGGPHAGDMPNQWVGTDGVMRSQIYNSRVTLDEGGAGVLGRAIVIHAGEDDYTSQPSGDAGERLACAVIDVE